MSVLNEAARAAITGGNLAHMVTLNEDGSPQASVVWVGLDGDDVVSAHLGRYKKLRNVERDPRVTISMEVDGPFEAGGLMKRHLVIEGIARVVEGGAPDLLRRLAEVYVGPGTGFPPPGTDPGAGFVLHVAPQRVRGVGPW
jgi:PPOX class probable F420-dependent enzyme